MASCMRAHTGVTVASEDPNFSLTKALIGGAQLLAENLEEDP